eukprot:m.108495 g.108495  ORF g.108495 m.108495 type:complete len:174 (+) comp13349_c0_seq2:186-707(+)
MAGRPTLTREFLISFRRLLHRSPELSWKETGTSQLIWQALEQLGLEPRRVAQHGIVADIPAEETGPLVALRADMDALPITEETNLSFASETPGVMHACGHDGHTTMLLGAASALVDGAPLKYPVRLLFQPAEETGKPTFPSPSPFPTRQTTGVASATSCTIQRTQTSSPKDCC